MGQKVNPISFRLGFSRTWDTSWFARDKKQYRENLLQDIKIRDAIRKELKESGVSRIGIERYVKKVVLNIFTAKPGVIIGKQGVSIQKLKEKLEKDFNKHLEINIKEIKKPNLDAYLIGESIGSMVSRRIPYRRACKAAIQKAMESGAKGIKILVSGRLNGVEIARREYFTEGNIPLQTLRSDIDYAIYHAATIYGIIGIKVWVYKGIYFKRKGLEAKHDLGNEEMTEHKAEELSTRPPRFDRPRRLPAEGTARRGAPARAKKA